MVGKVKANEGAHSEHLTNVLRTHNAGTVTTYYSHRTATNEPHCLNALENLVPSFCKVVGLLGLRVMRP